MKITTLLLFSILIVSCTSDNKYYEKSNVDILNVSISNRTIDIYYSVPLETMYYSSGVDYVFNDKSGKIDLSFVKQKIGTEGNSQIESFLLKNLDDSLKIKEFGINTYIVKIPQAEHLKNLNQNDNIINVVD